MPALQDSIDFIRTRAKGFVISLENLPVVSGTHFGDWDSTFSGRGIDMEEVREFRSGDRIEDIDPILSAKRRKPMVIDRIETREAKVLVIYDFSLSMVEIRDKILTSFAAASIITHSALSHNLPTCFWGVAGSHEAVRLPAAGEDQYVRITGLIQDVIYDFEKSHTKRLTLEGWRELLPPGSLVFIISDFLGENSFFMKLLENRYSRYRVVPVVVQNGFEHTFPEINSGNITIPVLDVSSGMLQYKTFTKKNCAQIRAENEERFAKLIAKFEDRNLRHAHIPNFDLEEIRQEIQKAIR